MNEAHLINELHKETTKQTETRSTGTDCHLPFFTVLQNCSSRFAMKCFHCVLENEAFQRVKCSFIRVLPS